MAKIIGFFTSVVSFTLLVSVVHHAQASLVPILNGQPSSALVASASIEKTGSAVHAQDNKTEHSANQLSVGYRWENAESQHHVSFTPAPGFFVLIGLVGASTLGFAGIQLRKDL